MINLHTAFPCWTTHCELSNFDLVLIVPSSHPCGLSISVLWTMIIHARFLIKTCHHASHFYALNKHNYLCICLEIFRSKCKPLARVNPIINRPLTNFGVKAHVKNKAFGCGYNKDKVSRGVEWHGQTVKYCSFFFYVCIFAAQINNF